MRPLEDTEAAWVTDYFGEDYLRLYQFPAERTGPEVAFLSAELRLRVPPGGLVLDLACGQGRHAAPLAREGFRVVGLDYQENLLREAARAARAEGAELLLVRGDMRLLPFGAATFDGVVSIFTAFGYFSDAENAVVLAEVARVLRPGGRFILDVANRDALLRHAKPQSWSRLPDGTLVVSDWQWDVPTGRYTHRQMLISERGQRAYTHAVRVYTCTELAGLLRGAGFSIEELHGGFEGEALTLDAPRMIFVARRRAPGAKRGARRPH